MHATTEERLQAVADWQLEFVRLIAFPVATPLFLEQQWWQELAGEQPSDYLPTRDPQFRDERGTVRGDLLVLRVDQRRIIWEVRSPRVVGPSGVFPTLGPFRERLAGFVAMIGPWLANSCPPLIRLSLSAKMLQPAATAGEAYRVLAAHLPAVKLDSNPNDFAVQINRRKATSDVIVGLPINRVCTWSKLNVPMFVEPLQPFEWPDRCYSALELDINTAPEKTDTLPAAVLPRLFGELVALGVEIAERGDTP